MARQGGTIFKDKDGKVTGEIAATQPAGTPSPSAPPSAKKSEGVGGAAGGSGTPDRPSPAAAKPTANKPKTAKSPRGGTKGNGK